MDQEYTSGPSQRDVAESFGSVAQRYDRARPDYPTDVLRWLVAGMEEPDVLDVGIGTGILARQLRNLGCQVRGVEIDPRMADVARRDGFEIDVVAFEDWEIPGQQFDLVVAGQTWHWVDPQRGAAQAAAALRPGGALALLWNVAQPQREIGDAFADAYRRVLPPPVVDGFMTALRDPLTTYEGMRATAKAGICSTERFGTPETRRDQWSRSYTRDEWLDLVPTQGGFGRLSASGQQILLTNMGDAIDSIGGRLQVDYSTMSIRAIRKTA
jgi:SAM-dependent methyltransferase